VVAVSINSVNPAEVGAALLVVALAEIRRLPESPDSTARPQGALSRMIEMKISADLATRLFISLASPKVRADFC